MGCGSYLQLHMALNPKPRISTGGRSPVSGEAMEGASRDSRSTASYLQKQEVREDRG